MSRAVGTKKGRKRLNLNTFVPHSPTAQCLHLSNSRTGPVLERSGRERKEEETRKKTGNEMEPPNAYLGIACLLVAPLVLPVSFFVSFFLLRARERRNKEEESRKSVGARELLLEEK